MPARTKTVRPRRAVPASTPAPAAPGWTFLTNHAHVLLCLAADPNARLRDVATRVCITERAVQAIIADLDTAGVLTRTRDGRRNHYTLHPDRPLRHPVEAHCSVRQLVEMVNGRLP